MTKPPDTATPPTRCPLCRASQARRLVTKHGWHVVRCVTCGLVFVRPQPTDAELAAYYGMATYHTDVDPAERRRYFAGRLRQVEELVPRRGRLLDVGCAQGYLLDVARDEGWHPFGIDRNPRTVAGARARGLDVREGELHPGLFEPASFDVVTLFDLIEHVRDPRALLAACRHVLKPDGCLVLTTPDISGLVPRATYALFALTLGAWGHPTPPGHLCQFSRATLRRMLAEEGFERALTRREHIPMGFSVGKLEDSIIDVLAGRHRTRVPSPDAESTEPCADGGTSLAKAVARAGVRAMSWVAVGSAGLLARAIGSGDSLFVAARPAPAGERTA
ncbi:class I SAM-dependent methyltransferase [bacterium]|nr:class I SAM-dependent methyltransferase [bacterium]